MMKIHITKQGESLDSVANTYAVSKQDLTGINPHINLASELVPGLKLKIPDASRTEKDTHIEKFYPNLDHNQYMKEQAVPIGLKPFEGTTHTTGNPEHHTASHPHPETPHQAPWAHLGEHTTHLTHETTPHHYPWNGQFSTFAPHDTRAIFPPVPYYPPYSPYPYPPYGYPGYGYGGVVPLPFPVPGFGGYGHGWHGGGHGGWHGHGGGHHR